MRHDRYWNDRFATESPHDKFDSKPLPKVPEYRTLNGGIPKPTFSTRENVHYKRPVNKAKRKSSNRAQPIRYPNISRVVNSDILLNTPRKDQLLQPILVDVGGSILENEDLSDDSFESHASQVNSKSSIHKLYRLHRVGQGSSATVYKSIFLANLQIVADKVIAGRSKEKRTFLSREIEALRTTGFMNDQCPSIIQFLDYIPHPQDGTISICLEYMDLGSLQDVIDIGGTQNEFNLRKIAFHVLEGLAYLHEHHILHRDLKPGRNLKTYSIIFFFTDSPQGMCFLILEARLR